MIFLETLALLLAAAVITVPLTRKLGLGGILGYLLAGLAIGPAGASLINDVETISEVSEFGVIMLLFLIGLELRPARLWVMRRAVLGLGGGQVLLTGLCLALLSWYVGYAWQASVVHGFGLALSSTAIILPMMGDRKLLGTPAGRDGFAVLLFQDLAFIPLIALVPLLAGNHGDVSAVAIWPAVVKAVGGIGIVLLGGRFLVRPIFRAIARLNAPDIFTAAALLLVAGTAVLVTLAGLSASLGAFMAGVLLSDSEYRHELQADIEPFESLLLGFFFMSVGMQVDLAMLLGQPWFIAGAVSTLIGVKFLIGVGLGLVGRQDRANAVRFGTALAQGSEFGFVLFGAAVAVGVMTQQQSNLAMLIIGASMIAAPILFAIEEKLVASRLIKQRPPTFDAIASDGQPVILCGFGTMGQVVARILRLQGIRLVALDRDQSQVDVARRFGSKVFFGDASRLELLRAAGAADAKVIVVALDEIEASLRLVETVRRYFPHLVIFARARNRHHLHMLVDRGASYVIRETYHSSLVLTHQLLEQLGVTPDQAARAIDVFRERDEQLIREQHAFYGDEKRLIQSTKEVVAELTALFEADRADAIFSVEDGEMPLAPLPKPSR